MNRKITAPQGAEIHYFEYVPYEGLTIPEMAQSLLELEAAGEDYLLEIRVGKMEGVSITTETCWICEWDLGSFEHGRRHFRMENIPHVLLPWYLCVEYEDHRFALYRMDNGTIAEGLSKQRRR